MTDAEQREAARQFVNRWMGKDFIDRKPRYCIWLVGADPGLLKKCPMILERVNKVREFRLSSTRANTKKRLRIQLYLHQYLNIKINILRFPKFLLRIVDIFQWII